MFANNLQQSTRNRLGTFMCDIATFVTNASTLSEPHFINQVPAPSHIVYLLETFPQSTRNCLSTFAPDFLQFVRKRPYP